MNNKQLPAPSRVVDNPEPSRPGPEDQDLVRLIALMERMGAAAESAT